MLLLLRRRLSFFQSMTCIVLIVLYSLLCDVCYRLACCKQSDDGLGRPVVDVEGEGVLKRHEPGPQGAKLGGRRAPDASDKGKTRSARGYVGSLAHT